MANKPIDITGQRFGRLVAIRPYERNRGTNKPILWLFKCDCGKDYIASGSAVKRGMACSCGCAITEPKTDLTGKRFGRLTVLKYAQKNKWLCRCDCGKETTPTMADLVKGKTKSCGCLGQEHRITASKKIHTTHGKTKSAEFTIWSSMKRRCQSPSSQSYSRYGGRGIKVCDRWLGEHGFENFLTDMGERPSSQHSIDRIDNDGNYEPENCRWATIYEQANNKSQNIQVHYRGETHTFAEWCRLLNVSDIETARYRYNTGKPLDFVFSNERPSNRKLTDEEVRAIRQEQLSPKQFNERFGKKVSNAVIIRVRKGISYKDII